MTVYAITDTKKGEQGLRLLIFILPKNSLPDFVVASPTINTFKARLDKFWENKMFHTIGKPTYRLSEVVVQLS